MRRYGKSGDERRRYSGAQQQLRRFAHMGYTLETDEEGVPLERSDVFRMKSTGGPCNPHGSLPATRVTQVEVLGAVVRLWRERRGFSLRETARQAQVGARFLSEFERGKPTVELGRAMQVIDSLDLELVIRQARRL